MDGDEGAGEGVGVGTGSLAWLPHGNTYPGPPSWVTELGLHTMSLESKSSDLALCPYSHFLFSACSLKGKGWRASQRRQWIYRDRGREAGVETQAYQLLPGDLGQVT